MLRKIRIGISALLFVLLITFFFSISEILPNSFHRLAHLQFVPALLSLSVGILLFLIVLTLVWTRLLFYNLSYGYFARCHCAPFKINRKKKKDIVTVPQKILRWGVLRTDSNRVSMRIYIYCRLSWIHTVRMYRIVVHIFKPIYMLEIIFGIRLSKFDNYTFYQVDPLF